VPSSTHWHVLPGYVQGRPAVQDARSISGMNRAGQPKLHVLSWL